MEKLIEKVDSYNLFNYLVPGALIYAFFTNILKFGSLEDIFIRVIVCYALGLVASRVGSIIFEWISKKLGLIVHSDYQLYVSACERDKKIELFVEIANMYRTIYAASIICFIASFIFEESNKYEIDLAAIRISLVVLAILFFFSYRKQSNYINQRVNRC